MNRKSKNLQLRWNLSKRRCDSTPLDCVGVENAVKGRDERRKQRAALDSIFNAIPPFVFFRLDRSRRCHRQNDRRRGGMANKEGVITDFLRSPPRWLPCLPFSSRA